MSESFLGPSPSAVFRCLALDFYRYDDFPGDDVLEKSTRKINGLNAFTKIRLKFLGSYINRKWPPVKHKTEIILTISIYFYNDNHLIELFQTFKKTQLKNFFSKESNRLFPSFFQKRLFPEEPIFNSYTHFCHWTVIYRKWTWTCVA